MAYRFFFLKPTCLTHSAREYFEKLAFKKNPTLNGCISNARANSESKLTFSESLFNFFQNRVVSCTRFTRVYTAGGSALYNPQCCCQWLDGLKELNIFVVIIFLGECVKNVFLQWLPKEYFSLLVLKVSFD